MLGFPVETLERRPPLSGVVVGRIETLEPHPNADRLQVCRVDVGSPQRLVIATAATNVAVGQVIPVATVGAQLVRDGQPLVIQPVDMRGVESQGMLCSADELGFDPALFEDGILQLDADLQLGLDVVEYFRLRDDVLEIEITPNRVDAMSMVGIARELGAAFGRDVREPLAFTSVPTASSHDATAGDLRVTIDSPDCRRFVAQRFSDVRVGTSPAWIRFRLALAGQRPINNLVDISNFVMLELGQPQHFYDADALAGRRLIVRDARPGETILTLGGEERKLDPRALVIADADKPQCLAGLRGAATSEVSKATSEIVVESANFVGPRIRRMGGALGLRTDASARHERGLTLAMPDVGSARAAELLALQGASAQPPFAVGAEAGERAQIPVDPRGVAALIGVDLLVHEVAHALRALGFEVTSVPATDQFGDEFESTLLVTPPYWRGDVAIFADVAEEVARIVGYDRIESATAPIFGQAISSPEYVHERHVAHAFAAAGYREVLTLSLQPRNVYERFVAAGIAVPHEPVEIQNPLSEDQRFMRFSLLPALLALAAKYGSQAPLRMFEIGHVFERAEPDPFEVSMTAWMYVASKVDEPAWRDSGFLTFKGEAMELIRAITGCAADAVTANARGIHPGKTAALIVDGKDVATIGAVDPRLLAAYEIDLPVYVGFLRTHDVPGYRVPRYRAPSRFPAVERDLALVVAPEIPARAVEHAIRVAAVEAVTEVHVFDEYRGPQVGDGRKGVAVRVRFQRDDATLTDAEVEKYRTAILASLRERVGAQIRE
jgi:phenylalanyl-tRNA synthetase beta chain